MVGGRFGIIAGDVLRGERIDLRPDTIHCVGNFKGITLVRTLEHHVLNKVRNTVFLARFKAGAGARKDTHTDRENPVDLFYDHPKSARKFFAVRHKSSLCR